MSIFDKIKSMVPGRTVKYTRPGYVETKPSKGVYWGIPGVPNSSKARPVQPKFKPGPVSNGKGVGY
jgi:hypothetical protein